MKKLLLILFITINLSSYAQVHTTYLWHLQQPNYWPDVSVTNPFSYQKVQESHFLKTNGQNVYSDGLAHPLNNLEEIFSKPDRVNVYQWGTKNAIESIDHLPEAGAQVNYGGCLIENINSLATLNQWGYVNNWKDNISSGQNNLSNDSYPRMDIMGFTMHHALSPLLSDDVLRKQIQTHKHTVQNNFNGNLSKGYWPAECSFSERIIQVLVEEGYEWSVVANSHLARTLQDYTVDYGTSGTNIDPPNKADIYTTNGVNWWNGQIDGRGGKFAAPYCYQAHKAQYINPETGQVFTLDVVPMAELLSYRDGFSEQGTEAIDTNIAPYDDPAHPSIVLLAHDGDNAWGGGSSYYEGAVPNFSNAAANQGYIPTNIQEFLDEHPLPTDDIVHVEDGSWFNAANDWGHPQFINWIWPMYDSNYEFDPNGWTEDARNWAVLTAAENFVIMAEDLEGILDIAEITAPSASASNAELAWHFLLPGYTSGYMYYGDALDMEVKQTIASNNAVSFAQQVIDANPSEDNTPPSIFIPQRYPYNPGEEGFGPNYGYQTHQNLTNFTVWTFAFDVNGIASTTLKYRIDTDGINPLTSYENETYSGGAGVGSWIDITMNERIFPKTNITNNPNIDFFVLPDYIANEYYAEITGITNKLVDYYIEVTDTEGNLTKSKIQHIWVGEDPASPPTVTITPEDNYAATAIDVTITATDTDTSNPIVYYTTDGSEPNVNTSASATVTVSFPITETTTVKAFALDAQAEQSETLTKTYYIGELADFSVYFKPPVSWSTIPNIYYWEEVPDGNLDDVSWPGMQMTDVGSGWFRFDFTNIASTNLIFNNGSEQTGDLYADTKAWYDWSNGWVGPQNLENPSITISPQTTQYTVGDTVTVLIEATDNNDPTPTIYYTTDASNPTTSSSSTTSSIAFDITTNTTVKSFSQDTDGNTSEILTKEYVFSESSNFITAYFKPPTGWSPKIHWWDALPNGSLSDSNWPGIDMQTHDTEWFKYEFPNTVQTINLLFHDNNGNQTEDLTGITQDIWYEWGVGVLSSVENNFNNSVSIYPNPTNDILFIETTTDIHSFQCYDTLRKMVLKGQIRNNKINVSTLSNGIYLLKLQDNNSFIYSKIIIKK